jgi:choice-of-anchor C domain-containing protein
MKKALICFLVLMACFVFSDAEANLLSNGSFENSSISPGSFATLSPFSTAVTDWTVWSGSIDYVGSYWTAEDGARSIDLNGGQAGSITTAFSTTPGEQYRVDFFMAGNPAGSPSLKTLDLRAYYNGLNFFIDHQEFSFDTTGKSLAAMGWEPHAFYFAAPSDNATLLFGSLVSGAYGPAIDNVTVTQVSAVPEPAMIFLFGISLASLVVGSGRRFRR